jgi:hypothetical protein
MTNAVGTPVHNVDVGLDVQTLELRFRVLLTEGGAERLELARV